MNRILRAMVYWYMFLALLVSVQGQTTATANRLQSSYTDYLQLGEDSNGILPAYRNGFILERVASINASHKTNIYLFRPGLKDPPVQLTHWMAGSSTVALTAVDIDSHGEIVSGGFSKASGGATFFLCIGDTGGSNNSFINTGAYLPTDIKIASDGSVWTIGGRPHNQGTSLFGVLRHYSRSGQLLAQALPKATTGGEFLPVGNSVKQTFLLISDKAIYVYDDVASRIYEWSPALTKSRIWSIDRGNMSGRTITGITLVNEVNLFASFRKGPGQSSLASGQRVARGIFELRQTDQSAAAWVPVEGTVTWGSTSEDPWQVLGSEGSRLVYATRPDKLGDTQLVWASQEATDQN